MSPRAALASGVLVSLADKRLLNEVAPARWWMLVLWDIQKHLLPLATTGHGPWGCPPGLKVPVGRPGQGSRGGCDPL